MVNIDIAYSVVISNHLMFACANGHRFLVLVNASRTDLLQVINVANSR